MEQAEQTASESTYFGTLMLKAGDVDGLVSGACHSTANTLRPGLQIIKTAPGVPLVSSFFLMIAPEQGNQYCKDGAFIFSDCGLEPNPDADKLAFIAVSAAKSAKALAGIDDKTDVISPEILAPIQTLKIDNLGNHNPRLHTDEVLIALAISAVNNPDAARAMAAIPKLKYSEVHSTVILSQVDSQTFRKLGVGLTTEPKYQTKKLYHN